MKCGNARQGSIDVPVRRRADAYGFSGNHSFDRSGRKTHDKKHPHDLSRHSGRIDAGRHGAGERKHDGHSGGHREPHPGVEKGTEQQCNHHRRSGNQGISRVDGSRSGATAWALRRHDGRHEQRPDSRLWQFEHEQRTRKYCAHTGQWTPHRYCQSRYHGAGQCRAN